MRIEGAKEDLGLGEPWQERVGSGGISAEVQVVPERLTTALLRSANGKLDGSGMLY